ncbi:MAG: hypothetical protein ACI3VN_05905 [Candidatus Onthomonas sp.]
MKHPFFTRSVSLLLAMLMVLSLPAAAVDAVNSAPDSQTAATAQDPFDDQQDTALPEAGDPSISTQMESGAQTDAEVSQQPDAVNPVYFDSEGNYLAPKKLVVYITAYADPEQTADGRIAEEKYTGIVAFYDYNEEDPEKMLETPHFFYYKEGILQDEEPLFSTTDRYLSLADTPTEQASLADGEETQPVYTAQEVYVVSDAEEHQSYLFAFNQDDEDNGLYTGEKDGVAYAAGVASAVHITGVTQDATTGGSPTLTWEAQEDAQQYQIYRREGADGAWAQIGTTDASTTSYTDTSATKAGQTYYYYVQAVYAEGSSPAEADVMEFICRPIPQVTAVSAAGGVRLTWTQDADATGYRVFRMAQSSKSWVVVDDLTTAAGESKKLQWQDANASSDDTYTYYVRAYYGTQQGDSREAYTAPVWSGYQASSAVYYLAAPTLTNAYGTSNGMVLCWDKVAGAESYRVYRKDASGGDWVRLATNTTITGTTFTDKTAEAGNSYYYTVRATKGSVLGPFFDLSNDPASAIAYHAIPAVTLKAGDGIVVSWSKDTTATGYRVFRQKSGETRWTVVANLAGGSTVTYTDTSAVSGTAYTYTVRAYYGESQKLSSDNNYNTNLWSSYKASSALTYVATPQLEATYSDAGGLRTTWTAVPNATGYLVYRRNNNAGSYTRIAQINNGKTTSYLDKTVTADAAYGYTVKATFKASDGNTYTSGYNNPTSSSVYHAAPTFKVAANATGNVIFWTLDSKATGYRIYRKVEDGSTTVLANVDAETLADATQGRYEDKNLTSGTKYSYSIRAYYGTTPLAKTGVDKSNCWSAASSQTAVFLSTPALSGTSMTASGVKISWTKVSGAAGYQVYRKKSGESWTKVTTISNGSTEVYLDSSKLSTGATYFYTVRAVASDNTSLSSYNTTGVLAVYLPAPALESVLCSSSGTTVKWKAVSGATGYMIYRKTANSSWERLAITADASTLAYKDTAVKDKNTAYYYTVKAYKTVTVNGKETNYQGAYDSNGMTFSITMSGSGWVKKDGNTYYVKDGICLVGWQYLSRNGGNYKYYFDTKTGALVTNLYSYFGKSYRNLKCRITVCINTNNSNPSYATIYLYDSETDSYCIPAVSVRCVGNPNKTMYSNKAKSAFLKAGTGQRWLDSGSYEQYASYISGTYSWFHSALYFGSMSPNSFSSSSYNSMVNNNNNSNGCVRMQCIYAYLIQDIMKNGYGKNNKVPVVLYKNTSNAGPFGVPKVDKISSRKTDPTDPAVTGKFFYDTSIWGVNAKADSKTWTYY